MKQERKSVRAGQWEWKQKQQRWLQHAYGISTWHVISTTTLLNILYPLNCICALCASKEEDDVEEKNAHTQYNGIWYAWIDHQP